MTLSSLKPSESWPSTKEEAALIVAWARKQAEKPVAGFRSFLEKVDPQWHWEWPYQQIIYRELDKMLRDPDYNRLMIFLPPRHGKSELVTVRFPIYLLTQRTNVRVVVAAYNSLLSEKFSRKSRKVLKQAQSVGYDIAPSPDRFSTIDWETANGGSYRAIGVGSGITGQGADWIIIDDPVKSREEANSPAYRERVSEWYRDDLFTRREPGAKIIVIQTRWHTEDLAGTILASEDGPNWHVVSLPAIAETEESDPLLRREVGDALCPERYDRKALIEIKTVLGSHSFAALYQQHPTALEGDMFKRHWIKYVDVVPKEGTRIRYWDRGATEGGGDFTVGTLLNIATDGNIYVEDVVRGQWSTFERDKIIVETARQDKECYGRVMIGLEQEPGSSGADVVRILTKKLIGHPVRADRPTGDKTVRAEPFAAQWEAGNVYVKKARWNDNWIDEFCAFPNDAHDDQVDSASGGFNMVVTKHKTKVAKNASWVGVY